MKKFQMIAVLMMWAACCTNASALDRPNLLLITVDDMSCDSIGAFGCKLPDTSPNIDRFAERSLRFWYAHTQVGNCMPGRNVMFSGRYPHNNGVEGFYQVKNEFPVMADLMQGAGYYTAIRGKVGHSTPYTPYPAWDVVLDEVTPGAHPKNAQSFYNSTKIGIDGAKKAGKPFWLLINISDPHKPFYATGKTGETIPDSNVPSRVFTADEVPVSGFLPDHPDVRRELAQYYSSVRRADDCFAATMKALDESGLADNTVIMFLSDHGMPLPFAKTAAYHHSTRTPWIVNYPGVTQPNSTDKEHMISAVDLLPTALDIVGIKHPAGLDGRSFLPLIYGKKQSGRDFVVKEYNENSGGGRHPIRAIQTKTGVYLWNPWSDGERVFKTATSGTMSYRAMKALAPNDPEVAARLDLFDYRVREEYYDTGSDPDALTNLVNDPGYRAEVDRLRSELLAWMERTNDHAIASFKDRHDEAAIQNYMTRIEEESAARRKAKLAKQRAQQSNRNNRNRAANNKNAPRRQSKTNLKLITVAAPKTATAGQSITLTIAHVLPAQMGTQKVHVTLKAGSASRRIERQILEITGTGELKVTFKIPANLSGDQIAFAAFVGADYPQSVQHINLKPMKVK